MQRSSFTAFSKFMLLGLLTSLGCRGGGDDDQGGSDEVGDGDGDGDGDEGEEPCKSCSGIAFVCTAYHPAFGWDPTPYFEDCAISEVAAAQMCHGAFGATGGPVTFGFTQFDVHTLACAALEEPDNCANWAPSSYVNYNVANGIYEIDEDFIDSLIDDPSPLIDCDAGRFDLRVSSPGYELADASSGELSYVLGLQNGDIPEEINNMSLEDIDDVLAAFLQLHYGNETEFVLEITRGGSPIVLEYEIVP